MSEERVMTATEALEAEKQALISKENARLKSYEREQIEASQAEERIEAAAIAGVDAVARGEQPYNPIAPDAFDNPKTGEKYVDRQITNVDVDGKGLDETVEAKDPFEGVKLHARRDVVVVRRYRPKSTIDLSAADSHLHIHQIVAVGDGYHTTSGDRVPVNLKPGEFVMLSSAAPPPIAYWHDFSLAETTDSAVACRISGVDINRWEVDSSRPKNLDSPLARPVGM